MNINLDLLFMIISYAIPYLALSFLLKNKPLEKALLENTLYIHLGVWKLSYIPLHFSDFIENPMSAFYFSGGNIGFIVSLILALCYLLFKSNFNISLLYYTLVYSLIGYGTYILLHEKLLLGILFILIAFVYRKLDHAISLAVTTIIFSLFYYGTTYLGEIHLTLFLIVLSSVLLVTYWKQLKIASIFVGIIAIMISYTFSTLPELRGHSLAIEWSSLKGTYMQENEIKNTSQLEKKIVVLNFFASWCPPCKAELPQLNRFWNEIQDKEHLVFLGVNATTTESSKEVAYSFVQQEGILFPVLYDEKGIWQNEFSITSFPTTIFVDSSGRIVKKHVGAISRDVLIDEIEKIQKNN